MSDSLKQAVEGMEAAWRRLREVLDGPDVAAALVERQADCGMRRIETAPKNGTFVYLEFNDSRATPVAAWTHEADGIGWGWHGRDRRPVRPCSTPVGWYPVK